MCFRADQHACAGAAAFAHLPLAHLPLLAGPDPASLFSPLALRSIPLFSALAGGLFLVSGLMLVLYLPAATHLKKLRMGAAGGCCKVLGRLGAVVSAALCCMRACISSARGCLPAPALLLLPTPCLSPPPTTPTPGDLVTLVAESLDGLGVIQAYNRQGYFTQLTSRRVDDANRSLFSAESLNLWLAFYCDMYGAIMVLAVASLGIGTWKDLGSSSVGLAFSQSIQVGGWVVVGGHAKDLSVVV